MCFVEHGIQRGPDASGQQAHWRSESTNSWGVQEMETTRLPRDLEEVAGEVQANVDIPEIIVNSFPGGAAGEFFQEAGNRSPG